ncbi:MAG TPA: hypothetical protein DEA90_05595 [Opitutae bacterium]|nr:hypothetical protein [Puniceicoccaceae bacterium]HBR93621.1 hypothetical protein [Opitutae bacterium]|tara:strand:- start:32606 stop:33616 length:1011 start_codon:yes stop_codon:yes gene_type:complete
MMKKILQNTAISFVALTAISAHAATNYTNGYSASTYYSMSNGDSVISFDWGADGAFYTMSTPGYSNVTVNRHSNGSSSPIYSNVNNFAGASVVAIGDSIYFNDSNYSNDQNIWQYNTSTGITSSSPISTTSNYALFGHGGELYITGAVGFGTNHIYHSALDSNGGLTSDPATDLGETFGASGPLAFDASGNLYYAPGFGDLSIYRWSFEEVAASIVDPVNNPLPTEDALWYNYSADFGSVSGGTGMIIDEDGELVISLTSFSGSSELVKFSVDSEGEYAGYESILSTSERLGDLRLYQGEVYFANGNEVLLLVPEPAAAALLIGLCALATGAVRRR